MMKYLHQLNEKIGQDRESNNFSKSFKKYS